MCFYSRHSRASGNPVSSEHKLGPRLRGDERNGVKQSHPALEPQRLDLLNVLNLLHPGEHLGGHAAVNLD